MTIGSNGAEFQTVNVTNGATNAIVLQNLTTTGTARCRSATRWSDRLWRLTHDDR